MFKTIWFFIRHLNIHIKYHITDASGNTVQLGDVILKEFMVILRKGSWVGYHFEITFLVDP